MTKKTLYIARHAKSSWDDMALSDFDRHLNSRGERDAPFMADILKKQNVKPDLILSSPAKRAKQTANHYHEILGGKLRFDEHIYEASHISLLDIIQEAFQEVNTLMIVGHNPGLTGLNDMLSNKSIYNLATASVVAIEFEDKVAPYKGKQKFFEYPKKYK